MVVVYVTLSVKTQLKIFCVICCYLQKIHPSYGKEHSVNFTFISLILSKIISCQRLQL